MDLAWNIMRLVWILNIFTKIQECLSGTYETTGNCTGQCSGNCMDEELCNNSSGVCETGCQPGYNYTRDQLCRHECAKYTFGYNCEMICPSTCNNGCDKFSTEAECIGGCKPNYEGADCLTENTKGNNDVQYTVALIISVTCNVLLLAALTILILYIMWIKRKCKQKLQISNKQPDVNTPQDPTKYYSLNLDQDTESVDNHKKFNEDAALYYSMARLSNDNHQTQNKTALTDVNITKYSDFINSLEQIPKSKLSDKASNKEPVMDSTATEEEGIYIDPDDSCKLSDKASNIEGAMDSTATKEEEIYIDPDDSCKLSDKASNIEPAMDSKATKEEEIYYNMAQDPDGLCVTVDERKNVNSAEMMVNELYE